MARRRLVVEPLERRLLLAGNVTASVAGGSLVVTGDDLGNQVQIADLGDGTYEVSGTDTTVNGGVDPFVSGVVTKGIKVDLKGGDDQLDILGDPDPFAVNGDLSIKMGDGEDGVVLENAVIGGKTTVDLGKGSGWVAIDAAQCDKDVAVKAGDAPGVEDPWVEVWITRTNVTGNLSVTTGKTNDVIWLDGVAVTKNVTITTGDGEDYAGVDAWREEPSFPLGGEGEDEGDVAEDEIRSLIEGSLSIDIGKCGGSMWLYESTVKKDVSFKAGDAPVFEEEFSNAVSVWDAVVEGKLTVTLGKGDAWVSFEQAEVKKDVSVTTNNGNDQVNFAPEFEDDEWEGAGEGEGEGDDDYCNNFFGKVTVNTGSGSDQVVIASAQVAGALAVDTGDGEDGVALWQVGADSTVSIKTGKHSDVIGVVELLAAGSVTVDSGNAGAGFSDRVILTDSAMDKDLSVRAGDGDDEVGIGDSDNIAAALAALLEEFGWEDFGIVSGAVEVLGKFAVGTGSGMDQLSIGWCDIAGSASVDTGSGDDLCEILDTTVGADATVKMGAGDDGLAVGGNEVTGKVTLDGGAGLDALEEVDENLFPSLVVKGFEILPI